MRKDITDQRRCKDYLNIRWCAMSVMLYVVLGLLFWSEYLFVTTICSSLFQSGSYILGSLYFIGWHILFILNLVSYLRCVFTDPGSVPKEVDIKTSEANSKK